jgi:hypothetical protein
VRHSPHRLFATGRGRHSAPALCDGQRQALRGGERGALTSPAASRGEDTLIAGSSLDQEGLGEAAGAGEVAPRLERVLSSSPPVAHTGLQAGLSTA